MKTASIKCAYVPVKNKEFFKKKSNKVSMLILKTIVNSGIRFVVSHKRGA